ncbi:uncharacterized protein [Triticum aestivum]|uniref:uncharacterized protein isoform X2 n=1 Tax=Triticum aestivum TaxID=4565 RepID=UPI001D006761|nr:uncharacterized protein LOC123072776 isoform X2 [Triticum aestivum]
MNLEEELGEEQGVKLQAGCMFLFVGNKTGSCTCFPFPLRWGRSVEVKQASTSPCLAYQGESEPLQRRGDTRVGGGQALLTDLRRSGKPAPHHWLLFGGGKGKAAEDVLLYARLSKYILAMMYLIYRRRRQADCTTRLLPFHLFLVMV